VTVGASAVAPPGTRSAARPPAVANRSSWASLMAAAVGADGVPDARASPEKAALKDSGGYESKSLSRASSASWRSTSSTTTMSPWVGAARAPLCEAAGGAPVPSAPTAGQTGSESDSAGSTVQWGAARGRRRQYAALRRGRLRSEARPRQQPVPLRGSAAGEERCSCGRCPLMLLGRPPHLAAVRRRHRARGGLDLWRLQCVCAAGYERPFRRRLPPHPTLRRYDPCAPQCRCLSGRASSVRSCWPVLVSLLL
jgi:hypothetical protein